MINNTVTNKKFSQLPQHAWALLVCQGLNVSLLVSELTSWMLLIISVCLCWRGLTLIKPAIKPQRLMILLLACSGSIAIAISGQELGVLLSMLHLLCFAYALKSLELTTRKDFYQIVLLGVFILASVLIFSQSLFLSFFVFCLLVLNLSLLSAYFSTPLPLKNNLYQSGKTVLQSIPLAVVLFVFFPRVAPFWQVPSAKSAQTGLSESVTPGDIAHLARSSALAFRVKFFTDIPQYNQLYWRAMVMDDFDGRTWQQSNISSVKNTGITNTPDITPATLIGEQTRYQVMVEPSYQRWLFSLAVVNPESLKDNQMTIDQGPNYTIINSKPVSQTSSYQISSYPQSLLNSPLSDHQWLTSLRLPSASNPKLQAQGRQLSLRYPDVIERAQAILNIIREEDFYYTLTPPLLTGAKSGHELDQFFYQTKKGFCVHYASVFTFMMRASGVPARLVTGYLGGEYNKQSGHLSIYQYDAHAWAEIWIKDQGWISVDPTSAVNPERVESGLSQMLQQEALFNNDFLNLHRYKHLAWLNNLRLQLDALDYQWTRLVLGYSSKKQYYLLKQWFGHLRAWKIAAIIGGALILLMSVMWLVNLKSAKRKPQVKWLAQYQQILALLKAKGLTKPDTMAASQFSRLVIERFPLLTTNFIAYTQSFEAIMYQALTPEQKAQCLIEMNYYQGQLTKQLKKLPKKPKVSD
ncbi:transglutaminaseTgpA domain-containing protein [Colwellia hornerae]|uniref:DUF3488 domain-containing protein n=1 Tax=Colwellia hornerae TaxID=89402 RepID=A0A5C6QR18_9GAMM|nr:DUF3488 and transglutaminase-like domain-containing protein [Colwellia hornerae]TWX55675.1 DUF3488 domain-containing protein [Colwellia hornerae]TWX61885.1 DUF3488 domain-containing protein [Colwellia hornerae]TWX71217.1 DUF3488 domain-containing protein [Colwellia hornerae]